MVRHYRRELVCSRSLQARWTQAVQPELRQVENSGSCLARAGPRWPVQVLRQAHHPLTAGLQRGHQSGATGTTGGPAGHFEGEALGYCLTRSVQARSRSAARFPPVHGFAAQRQPPRRRAGCLRDEHAFQDGGPTSPSGRAGLVSTCSCLPVLQYHCRCVSRSKVIRLTEYQFSSVLVDVQAGAVSIPVSSLPTWSWCTCCLREIHRPSEGGLELQHRSLTHRAEKCQTAK